MSRKLQENIVAATLFGIFVVAIVLAAGYSPRARIVPLPIATIGAVLALVQLVLQNLRSAGDLKVDAFELLTGQSEHADTGGGKDSHADEAGQWRREWVAIGLVLLLTLMVIAIGPLRSIFLFTAGYLTARRQYAWPLCIAFAAIFSLAIYVLFEVILKVRFDGDLLSALLET